MSIKLNSMRSTYYKHSTPSGLIRLKASMNPASFEDETGLLLFNPYRIGK